MLRHDAGAPSHTLFEDVNGVLGIDNVELAPLVVDVPGDFNGDGDVDDDDLNDPTSGWIARFGADLEGEDFLVWQRNIGAPLGLGGAAAVPEPAGFVMILAAAALGICRTRIQNPRPRLAPREDARRAPLPPLWALARRSLGLCCRAVWRREDSAAKR
jgi:hypothetical protein